jgi:hypothetical protein
MVLNSKDLKKRDSFQDIKNLIKAKKIFEGRKKYKFNLKDLSICEFDFSKLWLTSEKNKSKNFSEDFKMKRNISDVANVVDESKDSCVKTTRKTYFASKLI